MVLPRSDLAHSRLVRWRPPTPVRQVPRLLFVLGLATGACWLFQDGALTGQAAAALRSLFGPTGWLVSLWLLVLALRLDRWCRRPEQPLFGRRLLGAGMLSLAGLMLPWAPFALALSLAVLGSGLLLAGRPWQLLHAGLSLVWRRLVTPARLALRLLAAIVRVLLDPLLVPPLVPSEGPPMSHSAGTRDPRGRARSASAGLDGARRRPAPAPRRTPPRKRGQRILDTQPGTSGREPSSPRRVRSWIPTMLNRIGRLSGRGARAQQPRAEATLRDLREVDG